MTITFKNYFDILEHHTIKRGDKIALYCNGETVSYSLLEENVNRFGNMLKTLGVKPGEKIIVALPDCPHCFYAFLGSMKCGVWPILLSPDLLKENYEYILRDSQASALVTSSTSEALTAASNTIKITLSIDEARYHTLFHEAAPALDPLYNSADDIAFMLYTSGSTGKPKGVPHTQRDMLFCAENYAGPILGMTENDIVFSTSKLFFAYGLGNSLIFPLRFGASTLLFPQKTTPRDVFTMIADYRPTLFFCVPTLYNMLVKTMDESLSFDSLRLCISAGEALPAGIYHEWKKLTGLEIIDGIGSTEILHIFISNRPGNVHPGSSGYLVPQYEAMIIGEDGLPLEKASRERF